MSREKIVTAAIIRRNGSVLLARRSPSENLAGFWEFPGGKVEDGETSEECLARELREELGIQTTVGRNVLKVRINMSRQFSHCGTSRHGLPVISPLCADRVEWVRIRDLGEYQLLPADESIAAVVRNIEELA